MFTALAERQSAVVDAVLRSVPDGLSWRGFFLHAEYADELQSLDEAFFVLTVPDPVKPHSVPVEAAVWQALQDLYVAYRDAGQGFTQVDLTVLAPDGRHRFELGREPSLRLGGHRDPDAEGRLPRRYQQLLGELGLDAPAVPPPAPAAARPPPQRPVVKPGTAAKLARAVAIETESRSRHLASAERAEAEGRPQTARLFRAAARGESIQADMHRWLMGGEVDVPSTAAATHVGTTLENVAAAVEAENLEHDELYPQMRERAATEESTKVQDVFSWASTVAEARGWLFGVALERIRGGADMGEVSPYLVCPVCGMIELGVCPDETCTTCGNPSAKYVAVD